MKIIHLISGGDTGGAKTHILSLLRGLNAETRTELVCFMEGEFSREARELGILTTVMTGSMPSVLRRLRRKINDDGYDIIQSHGSRGNFIAACMHMATGLPVVSTVHSDYRLDYMGRFAARLLYGGLNSVALRMIDYHIGVSEQMRSLLISRGFKPNNVFTIYNGIDFTKTAPEVDKLTYLRGLGLEVTEESVVVGTAARLNPVKDIPTLIRGYAKAHEKCPQLRLVIAGDGQERARLQSLTEELGVSQSVCFAGWLDNMDAFYSCLDINTLTSLSETFPYALTEGARAHLPTIATGVGGVPSLITNGVTGFLFQPGDDGALAGFITRLTEDAELRHLMGDALFEKASREFSIENTWRRQCEIYREILRREQKRREGARDGIVICGAYGFRNAGDDAILEAIIRSMRGIDRGTQLTVICRRPRETAVSCGVDTVHMLNLPGFRRKMRRAKLYINGGGSLIQDVTSRRSLMFYLYTLHSAKRLGCKVMMYGCGIGPVRFRADRRLASKVINDCVDAISLREDESLEELRRMDVTKPALVLAADPAITTPVATDSDIDAVLIKHGLEPNGRYVCFALRKWPEFHEKVHCFVSAARYAWREYKAEPVLICIKSKGDQDAAAEVRAMLNDMPCHVISESMCSGLTVGILSRMMAVISIRLHGLIFAAGVGVPVIGVSYDPKVRSFMSYIGQPLCLDLATLSAEELCAMLDTAIRVTDRAELLRSAGRLAEIEHKNTETAARLLRS